MATRMKRQTMFTMGEVDVVTWKRTDVQGYLTAAQSLLNCEVGTTGLVRKSKGTEFCFNATSSSNIFSRMYEFQDKNGVYYMLIMREGTVDVWRKNSATSFTFVQAVTGMSYTNAQIRDVDFSTNNDTIVFTHPGYPPARIYVSQYTPGIIFTYEVLNIYPQPSFDFNDVDYNNWHVVSLAVASGVLTLVFGGVTPDPVMGAWVGGSIVAAGATVTQPIGYAIITGVSYNGGTSEITFTANVQIPFLTSGFSLSGSQYSIRKPCFEGIYPAKVCFYQNRLWFANTFNQPLTVFGSQLNDFLNFDVGVGLDSDAVIYGIGKSNSGSIVWMNAGKQFEIYTEKDEFVAPQDSNVGLTPTTFSVRQQSAYGSSPILKPVSYINDSYYVTTRRNAIINFQFDGIGQAYKSTNISVASSHLVKNPQTSCLLRGTDETQDNFIYFQNEDSTLTAFQFQHETKLAALTPIDFNQNEDNAALPIDVIATVSINNDVYLLKHYTTLNTFYIEVFSEDARMFCKINSTINSSNVISGLSALNGYTVRAVYLLDVAGTIFPQDIGGGVVSGGSVTVENFNNYPAGNVHVGIIYPWEVETMYLFAGSDESNFFKNTTNVFVDYYQTLELFVNGRLVPYQSFADIQAGIPMQPQTGTAIVSSGNGWNRYSTIRLTQNSPFDCQITSIQYQIDAHIV